MLIFRAIRILIKLFHQSTSRRYISFLRKQGVVIGNNVTFREPRSTRIDLSRPCLVEIGNDVDINSHFCIMTHDFANFVFRNLAYGYVNSSGHVYIGNNVYFGTSVTILKNVVIGNNCIIGACSVVTKDIPDNSVAVGNPCRVICSIKDYYTKRRSQGLFEAKEYIKRYKKLHNAPPPLSEMREEWIYFIDHTNMNEFREIPFDTKLGKAYNSWYYNWKAPYKTYEDFIDSI